MADRHEPELQKANKKMKRNITIVKIVTAFIVVMNATTVRQ